ncbi:hypothetical protein [Amycolatopsis rubida]|uniref:Uncharacterized protein n=1 Tax=Amycolatopsis rubida TaxID=112413 RepID=A0A1I5X709_9PSEU|nr:hypothetical protein [Amycolatopsis rubida]SFQ27779.1 hypothetical protein SAMN05421854_11071 [Amycolatopsis rubida]
MTKPKLLVLAAVVAIAAAAGITAAALSSPDTQPAKPCDIPNSVQEHPVSAKTAPGGGGIEVAEKGISSTGLASMGAILRNTSNQIAYRTKARLDVSLVLDGVEQGFDGPQLTMEIPAILPGQQVGLGRPLMALNANDKIASADVDIQTTTWLPPGALGSFAPPAATYESTDRASVSPPADAVRYKETSPNCRALANRRTAVIFRDATGAITGGDLVPPDGKGNPPGTPQQPPGSASCSPGTRTTWIVPLQHIPPETADPRTTLYPYCDLTAPRPDPNDTF